MEELLRLGVIIESVTFPDLPMIEAIDKVSSTPSINLTALLPRGAGIPDAVIDAPDFFVAVLKTKLAELPHDTTRAIVFTVPPLMTLLVVLTTGARFYARRKISGKLRTEDYWAAVATLFAITMMMMWIVPSLPDKHINGACGKHIWDISFNQLRTFLKLLNACFIIFSVGIIVVRIQFLVFYYNLSPSKTYRRLLLAAGAIILGISVASTFTLIFQCRPMNYWDHLLTMKCINRYKVYGAMGWMTMATDIVLLLIPTWLIFRLEKMKFWVKVQVTAVFAAGILVCAACVVRVIKVGHLVNAIDQPYLTPAPGAWGLVELNLATIISNIPTLKLYLSRKRRHARELSRPHENREESRRRFTLNKRPVASVFPIPKTDNTASSSDWTRKSSTTDWTRKGSEGDWTRKDSTWSDMTHVEKGFGGARKDAAATVTVPPSAAVAEPIASREDLEMQSLGIRAGQSDGRDGRDRLDEVGVAT